jgi:integrase
MAGNNKLTALQVQKAKPKQKNYKLSDGGGLYLHVMSTGSKYWRLKYRIHGKEKVLALGIYDPAKRDRHLSLDEARTKRDEAKILLREGRDPGIEKRKEKLLRKVISETTFESVARDWHKFTAQKKNWTEGHTADVIKSLEVDIFPSIGNLPITEITSDILRPVLEAVQSRGTLEVSKRLRQRCSAIFRYGKALGLCSEDPAEVLKDVLMTPTKKSLAAITPDELPAFLHALNKYNSHPQTRLAVRLLMLTFVRTSELIGARWSEIDFDKRIWNIPADRMKRRRPHYIPLSDQAIEVLNELYEFTGHRELLFPKRGEPRKPMSNGTILRVIDRIGYRNRMTGHGFRSLASTVLNESGKFRADAIERQLSHEQSDDVRAAYNRAEYYKERVEMMQWWADQIDSMERSDTVIPLQKIKSN